MAGSRDDGTFAENKAYHPNRRPVRTMTEAALGIMPVSTTASGRSTHEWESKEAKAINRAYKLLGNTPNPHEGMVMYEDPSTGAINTMHQNEWRLAAGPASNRSKFYKDSKSRGTVYEIPAHDDGENGWA